MVNAELRQLRVFLRVLDHQSFARAAADVGLSAPATSQSVSALEARLGVQLLRRTTRRVVPTPAGEELAARLGPLLAELDATLEEASGSARRVRGGLRLSIPHVAVQRWVAPWLAPFGKRYPDVTLEVIVDDAIVDAVAHRIDAGIRLGERLLPGMIAIPLGGSLRMAAVASPAYLALHDVPRHPRDLAKHRCIHQRLHASRSVYRWEFERNGRPIVLPPGPSGGGLIVNDSELAIAASLSGAGIAYVLDEQVKSHVAKKKLVRVLETWCPPFPGFFLYYASGERISPALRAFVDFVKASALSRAPS